MAALTADPNPVPPGLATGVTTITWDTGYDSDGEVSWVAPGEAERVIARGRQGSVAVEPVIVGNVYAVRLRLCGKTATLAEVAVTRNFWPRGDPETLGSLADIGSLDPPLNAVDLGGLRRVTPVSREFGFDRGQPIDRYYIEQFLSRHASHIKGDVLEIQDDSYSRFFGANIRRVDILDIDAGNPRATVLADLNDPEGLPAKAFDCVLLTQTLQLLRDPAAAIVAVAHSLKAGGVVLATLPGISQRSDGDIWYWRFTVESARSLFEDAFPAALIDVESHGNVLAAVAFLHGISAWELAASELDVADPLYDLVIGVRAQRAPE